MKRMTVGLVAALAMTAGALAAPRPDLVDKVASGELTEAKVSWWGYDPSDSTAFIAAALKSAAPTVVLDRVEGPWVSRRLFVGSNRTVVIPEDVELLAKRGEFHGQHDIFLALWNVTNVVFTGGGTVRMWFEDYTNRNLYAWSEWRHTFAIESCADIRIENLKIVDSGGDGIYVGQRDDGGPDRNVVIRDVLLKRCNRQGISVIAADELLIERTVMEDTCGTPPMAGIDFEPNYEYQTMRRVRMRDCISRNNRGSGFEFALGNLSALASPVSIALENCVSEGNKQPVIFQHSPSQMRGYRGIVAFRNCTFKEGGKGDLDRFKPTFRSWILGSSFATVFQNCRAADPDQGGALVPLEGEVFGWKSSAVTKAPDGLPLEIVPINRALTGAVEVHDRCPGEMVSLSKVGARRLFAYVVYAAKPGAVHLRGVLRRLNSQYKFAKCPLTVRRAAVRTWLESGKKIATLDGPTAFDAEFSADFDAPEAGFYRIDAAPSPNVLHLTACDAPIAVVCRENRLSVELNGAGTLYLDVPEGADKAVFAANIVGTSAHAGVRLRDPSGQAVWTEADVAGPALWRPQGTPSAGIWTFESFAPATSYFGDFTVDVFGLPAFLFLSSEKTWTLRAR